MPAGFRVLSLAVGDLAAALALVGVTDPDDTIPTDAIGALGAMVTAAEDDTGGTVRIDFGDVSSVTFPDGLEGAAVDVAFVDASEVVLVDGAFLLRPLPDGDWALGVALGAPGHGSSTPGAGRHDRVHRGARVTDRVGIGRAGLRPDGVRPRADHRGARAGGAAGSGDVQVDAARRLALGVGDPRIHDSAAALAADPDVQAVLVAVSSSRHLDAVRAIAAAGKDILCEKPLALTLAETDAAIAAAAAAGVRLQVAFMRRRDPDHVRAKARLGVR